MVMPANALPFGIEDVGLKPYSSAGVLGALVDLPGSRTFGFTEAEDFEELRGDGVLLAVRGKGPVMNWSLESGGIGLDAYVILAGGTVTTSGTTPAQKTTYSKKGRDVRPYFKGEGEAISDSSGDFHGIVYRCRAQGDVGGEMGDGAWWLTSASGIGLPDPATDALYDFVFNETAVPIA